MKKLLLMMLVLIVSACSKSDESQVVDKNNENLLIGKWYAVQWSSPNDPLSDCEKESYYSFRTDNTFSNVTSDEGGGSCSYGTPDIGNWRFQGDILILEYDNGTTYEVDEYEITTTKLTLNIIDAGESFVEIYEKR